MYKDIKHVCTNQSLKFPIKTLKYVKGQQIFYCFNGTTLNKSYISKGPIYLLQGRQRNLSVVQLLTFFKCN